MAHGLYVSFGLCLIAVARGESMRRASVSPLHLGSPWFMLVSSFETENRSRGRRLSERIEMYRMNSQNTDVVVVYAAWDMYFA